MNKPQLLSIINDILENGEKPKIEGLNESDSLQNDVGLDSLELAELTVAIEVKTVIDIFADGLVSTIGEILQKLK